MKTLGKILLVIGGIVYFWTIVEAYLGAMFGGFDRDMAKTGFVIALLLCLGGVWLCSFKSRQPSTRGRMYKGGQLVLLAVVVMMAATGCATYQYPSGSRVRQVEIQIPDEVVNFISKEGKNGIYHRNMPIEARYIAGLLTAAAGGVEVNDPNAPLRFEWGYSELPVSYTNPSVNNLTPGQGVAGCGFGAGCDPGAIGVLVLQRVFTGLAAVQNAITINSIPLGPSYYPAYQPQYIYAQRVTVWFFLTGTNSRGYQQLAFSGRGQVDYLPTDPRCDRLCAYESAAALALNQMGRR